MKNLILIGMPAQEKARSVSCLQSSRDIISWIPIWSFRSKPDFYCMRS